MSAKLIRGLIGAGLIQTGYFAGHTESDTRIPFRVHLELLPAYPDLLKTIAEAIADKLKQHPVERLICRLDSLPVGIAVSLMTGIPLVYSRGQGEAPNYDLVGAYDVGHPAALVTHILDSESETETYFNHVRLQAAKVGLQVEYGIAVLGLQTSDVVNVLIPMKAVVDWLVTEGQMSDHQRDAILDYLQAPR